MTALLLVAPALSALLLAAHFLRQGDLLAVVALIALVPLLALRRRWVANVARLTLWLGTGVWIYTLAGSAAERVRLGEPWMRMAVILGGVALATALSTLVFSSRRLRAFYGAAQPADAVVDEAVGEQEREYEQAAV